MQDSNSHLRHVLRAGNAEHSQAEDESGLPSLKDDVYQPHARPSHKSLYSIHFIDPKGEVRSFQYIHLDSNSSYTATCISLTFTGVGSTQVTIHGRNLWRLYDYIHQHRMAWVNTAIRDFAPNDQPIVTRVAFATAEESAEEGLHELEGSL